MRRAGTAGLRDATCSGRNVSGLFPAREKKISLTSIDGAALSASEGPRHRRAPRPDHEHRERRRHGVLARPIAPRPDDNQRNTDRDASEAQYDRCRPRCPARPARHGDQASQGHGRPDARQNNAEYHHRGAVPLALRRSLLSRLLILLGRQLGPRRGPSRRSRRITARRRPITRWRRTIAGRRGAITRRRRRRRRRISRRRRRIAGRWRRRARRRARIWRRRRRRRRQGRSVRRRLRARDLRRRAHAHNENGRRDHPRRHPVSPRKETTTPRASLGNCHTSPQKEHPDDGI